jgi:hypothetical protein
MRANLLDELRRPYVVTARAKGLSETRVDHEVSRPRRAEPFASNIAYLFPYLVSGSVIISIVLGLPTVGPLLVKALVAKDMFLAGSIVLLLGVLTVIGTFISDLVLMWVDPVCAIRWTDPVFVLLPSQAGFVGCRALRPGDAAPAARWWRFREAPELAMASGVIVLLFYVCRPRRRFFLGNNRPARHRLAHQLHRAAVDPWFDADGAFRPHVYGLKGVAQPQDLQACLYARPEPPRLCRAVQPRLQLRFLGITTDIHLLGLENPERGDGLFLLGTDQFGRDLSVAR